MLQRQIGYLRAWNPSIAPLVVGTWNRASVVSRYDKEVTTLELAPAMEASDSDYCAESARDSIRDIEELRCGLFDTRRQLGRNRRHCGLVLAFDHDAKDGLGAGSAQ